ncbi:MAG TPA: hypothetical protein V6C65_04915 [Allocoleopsis sp.]
MISLTISTWLTSTLHLNHTFEEKPEASKFQAPKLQWQKLWAWLTDACDAYPEPQVWQKRDRQGHLCWHAYDPMTRRSFWCESEDEMRQWLEERYSYQQSEYQQSEEKIRYQD